MKRLLFLLLTSTALCHAQDATPAPTPDYKAMYETAVQRVKEANAVALQWKEKAAQLEIENKKLVTNLADQKVVADILRKQSVAVGTQTIPVKSTLTADGIPSDVVAQIEARAKARHPDNYGTQEYVIRSEKESYIKLNSGKP